MKKEWKNALAGFGITIAVIAGFWYNGNKPPKIDIPPAPKPPVPNAFDTFAKAYANAKDIDAIGNSLTPKYDWVPDVQKSIKGLKPEQVQKYSAENIAAMNLLRSGFDQAYAAPPLRSIEQTMPYLADGRRLARILSFESRLEAQKGDWSAAVNDSLDCISMSNQLESQPPLIAKLASASINAIARPVAWSSIDHLNKSEAVAAAKRLETLISQGTPILKNWIGEEQFNEVELNELFRSRDAIALSTGDPTTLSQRFLANAYFTIRPKNESLSTFREYMLQVEKTSISPYPAALSFAKATPPDDAITKIIKPDVSRVLFINAQDLAFNRLLMTSFALQAYKLDHAGSYPEKLTQLVPKYLIAVPVDPFASTLTTQLIYRKKGASYLLYSVGPDSVDNGGTPIEHKISNGKLTPDICNHDDKGDLVAGINRN